jgi:hypothetical protein
MTFSSLTEASPFYDYRNQAMSAKKKNQAPKREKKGNVGLPQAFMSVPAAR